tara:strand:- start:22 stop:777 length:756 start_codon:yes stop_codon:yes gene_type:complete
MKVINNKSITEASTMKKAIFLFDYTGIMAKPWADAGYLCYCFDGQHNPGVSKSQHENILNVGMWFSDEVTGDISGDDINKVIAITGRDISLIFGFPECTQLAVSGAAHFAKKRDANPFFQDEAMVMVHLVKNLGDELACKWGLENPVSVISTMWRKPDFSFHPYEYGGYLPVNDVHPVYPEYIKPRDAYPKKTCIWSGNGFNKPPTVPVHVEPGFSDQHKKLGGKSLKTKNIRSATPRGFARAVFEANHES